MSQSLWSDLSVGLDLQLDQEGNPHVQEPFFLVMGREPAPSCPDLINSDTTVGSEHSWRARAVERVVHERWSGSWASSS